MAGWKKAITVEVVEVDCQNAAQVAGASAPSTNVGANPGRDSGRVLQSRFCSTGMKEESCSNALQVRANEWRMGNEIPQTEEWTKISGASYLWLIQHTHYLPVILPGQHCGSLP